MRHLPNLICLSTIVAGCNTTPTDDAAPGTEEPRPFSCADAHEPDDNLTSASDLVGSTRSGATPENADFFRVAFDAGETLTIELRSVGADLDLLLIDDTQTLVDASEGLDGNEAISHTNTSGSTEVLYAVVAGIGL